MRYTAYLLASLVMQVVAWIITPLLPLASERRYGYIKNAGYQGTGPRLKKWLSWFDTPDNSLDGDERFLRENDMGYWQKVKWLYRNSLYGFKWSVLACFAHPARMTCKGDPRVNRNNGITGLFRARTDDGYWQWKLVKKLYGNFGVMWNFGWQLDEFATGNVGGIALFQFSPRFVTIK